MGASAVRQAQPADGPRAAALRIARSNDDFEGILALQRANLRQALSPGEQAAGGFVFLQHDLAVLRRMAAKLPQAIALADGRVVGYCLALAVGLRHEVPDLEPMFVQFERCRHRGRALSSWRYFVGGQVCVDREFRGQRLAARLYREICGSLPAPYEVCVTEIAARNRASLSSHESMGFRRILDYSDGQEDWVICAWDLDGPGR